MKKNTQTIAFYILIPMLVFTLIATLISENLKSNDVSKKTIYEYFSYRNNKEVEKLKELLVNENDIDFIQSENEYLKSIKLLNIKEEKNDSLKMAYIKNNPIVKGKDTKIYKVKYEITYDSKSKLYNKSGTYESWYFLINTYKDNWLIDIGAV